MPFTHHSHSGQFCNHATSTLAECLSMAVDVRHMSVFAMTEHCPRSDLDLYPGEAESSWKSHDQYQIFDNFINEAKRLRSSLKQDGASAAAQKATVLIGFEAEYIRAEESPQIVHDLLKKHADTIEYYIGSVHHVRTIPIDFTKDMYVQVRNICGGSDDDIYAAYLDSQHEMLQQLTPKIIGHFDLIRLYSDEPDKDLRERDPKVWERVKRNLFVAEKSGALLEINTSAWRKGLKDPYPRREICKAWTDMGGLMVLSDDSHGVGHIGTNYEKLLQFIKEVGMKQIAHLDKDDQGRLITKTMTVDELERHPFWRTQAPRL